MRNRQRNSVWRGGGEPHLPRETPQGPAPPPTTALQSGGAPRELRSTSGEPPRVLRAPRPERGGSADPTHPGALAAHRDAQLGLDWTGLDGPGRAEPKKKHAGGPEQPLLRSHGTQPGPVRADPVPAGNPSPGRSDWKKPAGCAGWAGPGWLSLTVMRRQIWAGEGPGARLLGPAPRSQLRLC